MTRNNSERIGAAPQQEAVPAATAAPLSFVVPTEIVNLPSEGRFYPEGHPLHGVAQIELKQMTAKEEDILSNESYIKNGITLERLFESLIVGHSVRAADLLSGDLNAALHTARLTGLNPIYTPKVFCSLCLAPNPWNYDLSDAKVAYVSDIESEYGIKFTDDGKLIVRIDSMKADVELKLLYHADEKSIAKIIEYKKKHKLEEQPTVEFLRKIITSVNGDAAIVEPFIEAMPFNVSRYIKEQYRLLTPGVRLSGEFTCPSCEMSEEREVPMTAEFFWPRR